MTEINTPTEPYHEILDLTLGGWDYSETKPTREDRIAAHLTFIGDVAREHVQGSYGGVSEAEVVKEARGYLQAMKDAGAR